LIYNNLLYLIVVILIFSTNRVPESPLLPLQYGLPLFLLKAFIYHWLVTVVNRGKSMRSGRKYFAAEQRFSILAIVFFAVDVYLLDCKYYFSLLPLTGYLPSLINFGGMILYFFYLCIMWRAARGNYRSIFDKAYTAYNFLLYNVKTNLPIVLPWLLLSLLMDMVRLLSPSYMKYFPGSRWGEPLLLLLFFLLLAITFPVLVKWLWGCTSLPAGAVRHDMEKFCAKQNFKYSDIMLWPLFEGRILTAGVMGISKRFRYLLITPALLDALQEDELEAVVAHEIGHVKKYHLQLYLVLFLGFGLLTSLIANPLFYLLLNSNIFYRLVTFTNDTPGAALAFWITVPLFVIMILYFRYLFGFFMRNFERQADLHVFKAIGDSRSLIQSFEKIGMLSGNTRDLPSWHHFSIGQRVEFLKKCQVNRTLIKKHDYKVYGSLLLYLVILLGSAGFFYKMPLDSFKGQSGNKFAEVVLQQKIRQDPDNAFWHRLMGDLQLENNRKAEAAAAYEKALALAPHDPEILNNYAWLLITADDPRILAPVRALALAKMAVSRRPQGYLLDTLANAYWANDQVDAALAAERAAITADPPNSDYYRAQMKIFLNNRWQPGSRPAP